MSMRDSRAENEKKSVFSILLHTDISKPKKRCCWLSGTAEERKITERESGVFLFWSRPRIRWGNGGKKNTERKMQGRVNKRARSSVPTFPIPATFGKDEEQNQQASGCHLGQFCGEYIHCCILCTTQQFLKTRTRMNPRLGFFISLFIETTLLIPYLCIQPRPSQPPRWQYSPEVNAGFHAGVSLACGWVTWTRVGVFLFLFFDKRLAHVRRKSQIECSCPPNRVVYNSIELPQSDGGEGVLRICRG